MLNKKGYSFIVAIVLILNSCGSEKNQSESTQENESDSSRWIKTASHCKIWNAANKNLSVVDASWTGECKNGYAHGKGEMYMEWEDENNTIYSSTCTTNARKGKENGYSECRWQNGTTYKGTLKDIHIVAGVLTFQDGTTKELKWYETTDGCLVWNFAPQKDEVVTWTGSCIKGYGEKEGVLTYDSKAMKQVYKGKLLKGKMEGKGVFQWLKHDKPCDEVNGDIYYCYKEFNGNFKNNLLDEGVFTLISGRKVNNAVVPSTGSTYYTDAYSESSRAQGISIMDDYYADAYADIYDYYDSDTSYSPYYIPDNYYD